MRTSLKHQLARGHTLAAVACPAAALALASCLPMLVGCQTASPWARSVQKRSEAAQAAPTDSAVSKTDFKREVTQDQQYNMHLEFGRVLESEKQYDAALAEYQKALEACARRGFGSGVKGTGAKQALAHRRMGGALDRIGRFSQAEAHYQLALKASPDDANVWNDSGYSYYMQSRWVDAERNLKTAAKLAPDNIRIQTNLGLTLAAAGKTDEALVALSKAGGSGIGHANLGYLLAAMGQTDKAREHYERALQIQPNLGPARQALAALATRQPQVEQIASGAGTLAPNSDVRIERVSSPQPAPAPVTMPVQPGSTTVPPQRLPEPRVAPAFAPPLSGPQVSPSAAAGPLSMTLPPREASRPLVMKPAGPRATPVAVTPMEDRRTGVRSLPLASHSRANKLPTQTMAAPPVIKVPRPTASAPLVSSTSRPPVDGNSLASTARSSASDPNPDRVSLPPIYDPRKPVISPAMSNTKVARVALPPVYDPRKPVTQTAKPDPGLARTSLPPVYDPRSVSVPYTRDYNPRPLSGTLPPVSDPRTTPLVLPATKDSSTGAGARPGSLPPVYDPRMLPASPTISSDPQSPPTSAFLASPPK